MSANGWSILRFWHVDVLADREAVLETIVAALNGELQEKVAATDLRFVPKREANR